MLVTFQNFERWNLQCSYIWGLVHVCIFSFYLLHVYVSSWGQFLVVSQAILVWCFEVSPLVLQVRLSVYWCPYPLQWATWRRCVRYRFPHPSQRAIWSRSIKHWCPHPLQWATWGNGCRNLRFYFSWGSHFINKFYRFWESTEQVHQGNHFIPLQLQLKANTNKLQLK